MNISISISIYNSIYIYHTQAQVEYMHSFVRACVCAI